MITKEQVDQVFADAEHQFDYWLALYKLAYGDHWKRVKFVEKWPLVSNEMNDYIHNLAHDFDVRVHPNVLPGGIWMNKGFESSGDVTLWGEVVLQDTIWKEVSSGDDTEVQSP